MKKMFLLLPVGLVAASGFFLLSSQNSVNPTTAKKVEISVASKNSEQLFTLSQDSLREIVRHGDGASIAVLEESVGELESRLPRYERQGLNVGKVKILISQYKEDASALSQTTQPYLEKIKGYDSYEEKEEEKFLLAIDQIGLYDLKTNYQKLSKIRVDYLKEPSDELAQEYRASAEMLTQTIKELYLDSTIEDPLYAFINNHKGYFETLSTCYNKAGIQRVNRLRQNSYAIKTELQMLPTI